MTSLFWRGFGRLFVKTCLMWKISGWNSEMSNWQGYDKSRRIGQSTWKPCICRDRENFERTSPPTDVVSQKYISKNKKSVQNWSRQLIRGSQESKKEVHFCKGDSDLLQILGDFLFTWVWLGGVDARVPQVMTKLIITWGESPHVNNSSKMGWLFHLRRGVY